MNNTIDKPLSAKEKKALLAQTPQPPPQTQVQNESRNFRNDIRTTGLQFPSSDSDYLSLDEISDCRITDKTIVKPLTPTVWVSGSRFAVKGDLSMISGPPKAGKSTTTKMILATALMEKIPDNLDTLGIRSEYASGQNIIYLDTEQNPADTVELKNNVLQIAGMKVQPPNFHVYNLREKDWNYNVKFLASIFQRVKDIHLIIIDGITDFLPSANDEVAGNVMIRYLMKQSTVCNTCIIALIHENGASAVGKMRGHIGAEAARKCQGTISVRFDDAKGVHAIHAVYLRKAKKFDPIYWTSNEGIPQSCDASMIEDFKKQETAENATVKECMLILQKVFEKVTTDTAIEEQKLKQLVKTYLPTKEKDSAESIRKRADARFKKMKELALITEISENHYIYQDPKDQEINF